MSQEVCLVPPPPPSSATTSAASTMLNIGNYRRLPSPSSSTRKSRKKQQQQPPPPPPPDHQQGHLPSLNGCMKDHHNREQWTRFLSSRILLRKQCQIYTDWANHYLKKRYHELAFSPTSDDGTRIPGAVRANNHPHHPHHHHHQQQQQRPVITSLVNDLHDGILLIYLVESVTDSTIASSSAAYQTNLAPKNEDQMIANIETCLRFLNNLGVNIHGIHAKDIHDGNLKSILTLFFNISRYKQNLKKQEATIVDGKPARFIHNKNQHHYHQYEPSSPNITSEDESGCLTDFSISSSTQSLLLSSPITGIQHPPHQNGANPSPLLFKQMTPPPTSSAMISRFSPSGSHHHSNTTKSIHHQINGVGNGSKLVQPTTANNNVGNGSSSSSSIPVPGSNNGTINNNNVNPAKKSSSSTVISSSSSSSVPNPSSSNSAKVSSSSLSINNHHPNASQNLQATPTNAANSNNNNSNNNTGLPQINRSLAAVQNRHHITPPGSTASNAAQQRPTRPQSTSSIPQIGNLSTVVKPTVAVGLKKSSTPTTTVGSSNVKSTQQKATPSSAKSQDSGRRFINGGGGGTRLNPSQSELNLRRPSGTTTSSSTVSNNTTSSNTPTTIPAAKGGRFQLRRLPPPSSVDKNSNPLVNRRPISTIIESATASPNSLPSSSSSSSSSTSTTNMSMTTSCPNNTTSNMNQSSANLHSSLSSITKPMATVKAMVTPIMSTADSLTNLKSDMKKIHPDPKHGNKGILRSNLQQQKTPREGQHQPQEPRASASGKKSNQTKESFTSSSSSSSSSASMLNRQDSNVTIQSGNSSDGNTSEDLEIPPVMEKPLQTICYLKSANNNNSNNSNSSNNVSVMTNGHAGSRTTTPTIMFRKPENVQPIQQQQQQQQQSNRSGRSHYEPLYSNGPQPGPVKQTQPGSTTTNNLHRLSQGADYYGSDNSDSRQNDDPNTNGDPDFPNDDDPAATRTTTTNNNNQRSYEAKNHLVVSDPNTLINLHIPERSPRILRLKHSFSHPANGSMATSQYNDDDDKNHLGFDETSSISSDAGMVSGTDISGTTTTTTTSTSCSSFNERQRPKSSQNRLLFNKSSLADSSPPPPPQQQQQQQRLLSNSTTELYKSNSSSSIANHHHHHNTVMTKLSSVGHHSGTLPLNIGSMDTTNGASAFSSFNGNGNFGKLHGPAPMATAPPPPPPPPPARCLANQHRFLSKSSKFQQRSNNDPSTMVYSDSETLQPQSQSQSSRSTFSLFSNKFIGPPQQRCSSGGKCFSVSSKDGSSSGYGELIYSNVHHHQRHPSTDTESIDSLNTIGSSKSSLQQHQQHQPQHSIYSNGPGSGSKPGDLICEYESVNRLRETMSASPTTTTINGNGGNHHHQLQHHHNNKISMNGIYSETNGVGDGGGGGGGGGHLGRSGSFRLANGHHNHHHHHHLPPIPAHLNKIKEQQQQQSSSTAPQSEHSASSLSLLSSNSSSIFTTPEEKYIHEIRRLRRELDQANEKIYTLTSQLTANAHMVAAFEQSLSSMTTRLQQLSSNSELKDCELDRLRKTIDVLKKQGGSLVGHAKSATISPMFNNNNHNQHATSDKFQRYLSSESVNSVSSCDHNGGGGGGQQNKLLSKKKSKLNKLTSGATNTSWIRSSFSRAFKKKSSSSSSQKDSIRNRDGTVSDHETVMNGGNATSGGGGGGGPQSEPECGNFVHSVPNSPMLPKRNLPHKSTHPRSMSESKASQDQAEEPEELKDLRKQLREKEMQLTDIRLESLTSAHQLENLKEIVNQMRMEMMNLKQDNDRLQRLVHHKSLASSQSSMTSAIGSHGSSTLPSIAVTSNGGGGGGGGGHSNSGIPLMPPMMTMMMEDSNSFESVDMDNSPLHSSSAMNDGHRLVTLGSGSHILATLSINAKTNWEQLDLLIKKCFKDHLIRVDGSLTLGITVDSLACYKVGVERVQRNFHAINGQLNNNDHATAPELLPFGYLVNENHINLQFKSAIDSLAFDTLTPKSVLQEFIAMLNENRRLIFAGPSGTGKTYLAHKLAEYMAIKQMDPGSSSAVSGSCLSPRHTPIGDRSGGGCPSGSIATFNVDHKNAKELRAYLTNIAEQCQMDVPVTPIPAVIILDNLHHSVDSLEDIFNDLHKISSAKSPYIIGTINQSVHHNQTMKMFQHYNFHWIMLSVNSEAVKGYLNRLLRRKLLETEARMAMNNQKLNPDIMKIIDWIPKVYAHLNKFLESYFGENISIGARLFTSCPIDLNGSQAWFTDLWNYSILPFIIENVREHVRQNGGRLPRSASKPSMISFIDPTDWIVANYPWQSNAEWSDHLNRLRPEDFEDDTGGGGDGAKFVQNSLNTNTNTNNNNNSSQETTRALNSNEQSTKTLSMDSFEQSAKDIKDPFLQMLLKLKEASEYSSQECVLNDNDNGGDQSVQEI